MTHWAFNLSRRTHLLFAPILFIMLSGGLSITASLLSTGDLVRSTLPYPHFVGTTLLFILMPAYLLIALVKLWENTELMLTQLKASSSDRDRSLVREAMKRTPFWRYLVILIGFLFGLSQNGLYLRTIIETSESTMLDIVFVLQSACLWIIIADFIAWRISVSYVISNFTQTLRVDIYDTARYRVVAKMATSDVLIVAGAMAFMPLQSLDAEFRIWNYQAGFIIGISTAICLFMVPLIGARHSISMLKSQKLADLIKLRSAIPRKDVAQLEAHLSHEDRIRSIPNWPIDLNLITRIIGYVIIPPIAWVGAALVERIVNAN